MNENPIKPTQAETKAVAKPSVKVTKIKSGRGEFMRGGSGTGAFDPGQRTVLPGYRPKRGKFMDGDND